MGCGLALETNEINVDSRIAIETSPRAVAKSILSQLFEKRIGNTQLLQILTDTYERSLTTATKEEHDDLVWEALSEALAAPLPGSKELVLVVDGLDESSCGEAPLVQRLNIAAKAGPNVRLITLGSEKPSETPSDGSILITDDLISDDIVAVTRRQFEHARSFRSLGEFDQETIVTRITEASNGSFLWAKLATKQACEATSAESLRKAADTLVDSKPSVKDLVAHCVHSPGVKGATRHMLLWLATAGRPLSLKELSALASVQVDEKTALEQTDNDLLGALRPVRSLVFFQDGLTYLRHGLICEAIVDVFVEGKLVPDIIDRHQDLASRLLLYIKSNVTQQQDTSLTPLDDYDMSQLLGKYPLLDFAIRHWPVHVMKTLAFAKGGTAGVVKTFSHVMPTSTAVLLLQGTLWQHRPVPVLLIHQAMVTDIYRQMLKSKHPVTLQAMIMQAMLYLRVDYIAQATPLFYEATMTAKTLLGPRDPVTLQLASTYLEITSKTDTDVTEIMAQREEAMLLLAECYKTQFGQSSEYVVSTLRMLVDHYRATNQEQKAQQTSDSINSITANEVDDRDGELLVRLKGRREKPAAEDGVSLILDSEEQDDPVGASGSQDFELSLKKAQKDADNGRLEAAENMYIELWQRASREYRVHRSDVWEERKLRAILGYNKFLLAQNREVDASAVLSSVWEDYKKNNTVAMTGSFAALFLELSKAMKEAGLYSESLFILKNTAQHCQSDNQTQNQTYREIQQNIQSTSGELMQMIGSPNARVTSESTLEDMVLQAFKSGSFDQTTITAAFNLISLYTSQHRWHDATRLTKRVLRILWPSLFIASVQDVVAPTKNVPSCVELAQRLAACYHTRRRLTKEGDIRERVYSAMRTSRKVDDKLRERVTLQLLDLLEEQTQTDKLIKVRQEMLEDYTAHYGEDHASVIKMLWQLAELTRPRAIFVQYYQDIIRVLNKGSETAKVETFEPVVIVAEELWERGHIADASHYYKILLEMFFTMPMAKPELQDQAFVKRVFNRYTHHLRNAGTEFLVIHNIMAAYREQCKVVFGLNATITIQATLALARMCQDTENNEVEAIKLYEELLQTDSREVNYNDITATLESLYEDQVEVAAWDETKTVTQPQVDRAVKVLERRLPVIRETHGWAHEESLAKLTELVRLRSRQNQPGRLCVELRDAAINVLRTETSSARLVAAASTIAAGYISTDQVQKATELQQELYRQMIMKDTKNAGAVGFDVSHYGRDRLVFLAQLECSLRRNTTTMTETLASLTTQYVYFQEMRELMMSKSSSLHQVTVATARLESLLAVNDRQTVAAAVFGDFVAYFLGTEGKRIKLTKLSQVEVFLRVLLQHFFTHKSHDFIRSVGISGNNGVTRLLGARRYDAACDLALATFTYISAHEAYHTPVMAKLVLTLGMNIAGRELSPRPDGPARKNMLDASATILRDVLHVLNGMKVNLEKISLHHLNKVIGLLGEQQDYRTLSWLLTVLWNSRDDHQSSWRLPVTLPLGQRYIMARYLVGESTAAVRLAEDIIYNCRRVHGTRHPATLEMSIFLTQLYTSIAQRYQSQNASAKEVPNKYYKKSAAVHENILRVFTDPSYAELETVFDGTSAESGSNFGPDPVGDFKEQAALPDGQYVRRHMRYMKLALERLGSWPKDYAEYERLNAEIFRQYPDDLKDVAGVEKWNLRGYGAGKAEAKDDLLNTGFNNWEILISRNGETE